MSGRSTSVSAPGAPHALLQDQLLRMAFERLPLSLLMTLGVTAVFFGLLWPLAPRHLMLIWGASILVSVLLRHLLWWMWRRAAVGRWVKCRANGPLPDPAPPEAGLRAGATQGESA